MKDFFTRFWYVTLVMMLLLLTVALCG